MFSPLLETRGVALIPYLNFLNICSSVCERVGIVVLEFCIICVIYLVKTFVNFGLHSMALAYIPTTS